MRAHVIAVDSTWEVMSDPTLNSPTTEGSSLSFWTLPRWSLNVWQKSANCSKPSAFSSSLSYTWERSTGECVFCDIWFACRSSSLKTCRNQLKGLKGHILWTRHPLFVLPKQFFLRILDSEIFNCGFNIAGASQTTSKASLMQKDLEIPDYENV